MIEKRKYTRYDFIKDIQVFALNEFTGQKIEYYGRGVNICQGGILFYSIADFTAKANCLISLNYKFINRIEKNGIILRINNPDESEKRSENEILYAMQFNTIISEEELGGIVNPIQKQT